MRRNVIYLRLMRLTTLWMARTTELRAVCQASARYLVLDLLVRLLMLGWWIYYYLLFVLLLEYCNKCFQLLNWIKCTVIEWYKHCLYNQGANQGRPLCLPPLYVLYYNSLRKEWSHRSPSHPSNKGHVRWRLERGEFELWNQFGYCRYSTRFFSVSDW
jgi:hypothetical protein